MELDLKAAKQNLPDLERNAAELKEQAIVSADEKAQISALSRQVRTVLILPFSIIPGNTNLLSPPIHQLEQKKRDYSNASKASGLELHVEMLQKQ